MASVEAHYANHLAPLYTWMAGGAGGPRQRFASLCGTLGLKPSRPGATALDLGAGSGFQSIPLAELGYSVTAIDLSTELLAELVRDAAHLPVKTVCGDLCDLPRFTPVPAPEVIVCMGDTLTHLPSLEAVARVVRDAASALAPGGHLLLSFRDNTADQIGIDRFIPVRSDDERIFTCFLEFAADRLTVHDIVHSKTGGAWRMAVSSYQKIRLAPSRVTDQIAAAQLARVRNTAENGLVTLVAQRPVSG